MFMKSEKKKGRHLLAVGVGAMAIYGAYSVVSCIKQMCCEKMHMLTNVVKNKKNKDDDCASACENE